VAALVETGSMEEPFMPLGLECAATGCFCLRNTVEGYLGPCQSKGGVKRIDGMPWGEPEVVGGSTGPWRGKRVLPRRKSIRSMRKGVLARAMKMKMKMKMKL